MRINHNMPAINAHRNMGLTATGMGKVQERLSSGLRINRAADDAAGLAISETMRAQIRGLDQASRNSQDAISLIQTAEGALTETHSILHRMRELAVQAANDSYTANDRIEIQKEIDQLKSEVDRIANTTSFNNKNLLDGTASALVSSDRNSTQVFMRGALSENGVSYAGTYRINVQVAVGAGGATDIQTSNVMQDRTNNGYVATASTKLSDVAQFYDVNGKFLLDNPATITIVQGDGQRAQFNINGNDTLRAVAAKFKDAIIKDLGQSSIAGLTAGGVSANIGEYNTTIVDSNTSENTSGTFILRSAKAGPDGEFNVIADQSIINAFGFSSYQKATTTQYTVTVDNVSTGQNVLTGVTVLGNNMLGMVYKNVDVKFDTNTATTAEYSSGKFVASQGTTANTYIHLVDSSQVFQIGANELQNMNAAIGDMRTAALNINNILVTDIESAGKSVTKLDQAISRVSAQRSSLGAVQNRLEHTIANLGVASENMSAAESRIRDADMAKEMMEFTRLSILSQSTTAMLAQANQQPQQVLQLLGG